MSIVRRPRILGAIPVAVALIAFAGSVAAQTPGAPAPEHQHQADAPDQDAHADHDVSEMAREGSGTSRLPDDSPMYAIHALRGPWTLMFHENAFLQFFHESGPRGDDQVGSVNWLMGMARRNVGPGRLGLRGMFSLEPWSIRGCGYPDLLATGEECHGQKIHDLQHPHDVFMEVAADYSAPITGQIRWHVYAAPVGEPALGPVAFPHRISALANPIAPMSHHWLDATHLSFGVVTGGVSATKWKAEASVFNGREPDETRTDFDFGAMDSVSGRVWLLPTRRLALQVSAGHLKGAEPGEAGGPRINVNRLTASATYHRPFRDDGIWATTFAWGRNAEEGHGSNAVLLETSVTFRQRDTVFGRFEAAGKSAHDLVVPEPPDAFTVAKLQGGYSRYLGARHGFQPGIGAGIAIGIVPEALRPVYGSRLNTGVALFLTLRPAARAPGVHAAHTAGASTTGPSMVMVRTAFDPSKLTCSAAVDRNTAAATRYEGKTYYFCSAADRDRFLTDPKMSLSMMPPKQ